MNKSFFVASLATVLILSACGGDKTHADKETQTQPPMTTETQVPATVLKTVIAGDWRVEDAKRDVYRHPGATLEFFGLKDGESVLEIFPGGSGWYTNILAPFNAKTHGTYTAAVFGSSLGERYVAANDKFITKFSNPDLYGTVNTVEFGPKTPPLPAGSYDLILSFRNVHSWMGRGFADKAFADFYHGLKPGGTLGIVEHRFPESREQDPKAGSGYVQVSYTKDLAKAAGFEFVGASEINANPKDTADHPMGVWTLPPVSAKPKADDPRAEGFDPQKYLDIGESDRYTLMFRKPKT